MKTAQPVRMTIQLAAALALLAGACGASTGQGLSVGDLRCEYERAPLGVDSARPRLSWLLRSARRGEAQTGYRVLVASSAELLARDRGDLWDSGKVSSDRSIQVEYAGKPLSSRLRCYWKVRAWDVAGNPSPWSQPAAWTMGLFSPRDWKGRWIQAPTPADGRLPLFRTAFRVAKPVRRAELTICGLGASEVHLNGRLADDACFEPGWTNYRKTCLYRTLDLTGKLRAGENVLGVMLGNGMYNVTGGRYVKFTGTFGPPKLVVQLHIDYADGSRQVVASGKGWATSPGPITFSCVYGGEDYDARLEQPGWDKPGFAAAGWASAQECDGPGGVLTGLSRSAPPVRPLRTFSTIMKRQIRPGVWLYDLGQNGSMLPRFTVSGPAGKRVTIRTGEKFEGDRYVGVCHDMASYSYTLKGSGVEVWQPRFTYAGARYYVVEGADAAGGAASTGLPVVRKVEGVFVSGSSESAGEFACSNPTFMRTADLIRWAMRSNMMSLLTDCPHREKLGWLEQDHLVGPSLMYSYQLPGLFTKVAGDMADSQLPDGLVPDIAPEYVVFSAGFRDSPEWGSACILVPWQMYQWYGDKAILRRHYGMMKRYVAYLGTKAQGGILSHGLADWIAIQGTPTPQIATGFYYLSIRAVEQTARALGEKADAVTYARLGREVRDAYNAQFYDAKARKYASGTQTANALPVGLGIAPEADVPAIVDEIVRDIRAHGNALTVGEIGYPYMLRVLAAAGRSDVIADMNRGSDHPGYGMMIAKGSTSLPESWDANPDLSLNHFMLGHIMEWFYSTLAGIRLDPSAPAFKRVVIKPEPVGGITWARARYLSPYGPIRSAWAKRDGALTLEVTIPPNATAVVSVPLGPRRMVTESGKQAATAPGVRALGAAGGRATYTVASGSYTFVSR